MSTRCSSKTLSNFYFYRHSLTATNLQNLIAINLHFKIVVDTVQSLTNSIGFDRDTGTLNFTIPDGLPEEYSFYIHVSGRVKAGDSGMSFHLFEEESENNAWKLGKTYSHEFGKDVLLEALLVTGVQELGSPDVLYETQINIDENGNISRADISNQNMLTIITFPVNDGEYNAAMYEIEPFDFYLSLPDDWTFREWGASNTLALIGVFSKRTIFNENNECVGAVGCNIYEPYEGAEEDPRAIYNQIALGNNYHFDVRDSYKVVSETDSGKTATADVYYSANINNGAEKTNKGIVSYNKDFLVYIAMEFDSEKVTDEQIASIAKSVRITASAFTGAVAQANRDKEQILKALQDKIGQYRNGTVVNNELEPRFDALPDDAVLRDLNSVDDFAIETSGNDMFAIRVTLDIGRYTINFYLSPMGLRAEEIANGRAKEDDYVWAVNAVGIHPIPELQYDFFTVPEMSAVQQEYYDGYLRQLIYSSLLMRDWSDQDYSALAVDHAGSSFANYLILAFEDIVGSDEMQKLFTEYNGDFPASVIEDVLLPRFPFTTSQLHEILAYHYRADTNTYYYEGGRGGGPIEAAITGVRTQGEFVYLDYEVFNGYSGLDEIPATYLYKTPGVLTLRRNADGSYRYYAVDVGEQEEAPPRS